MPSLQRVVHLAKTHLLKKTYVMKTSMLRFCCLLLASAIFSMAATSCNTTRGFGRDVKKVGNRIENAAS